MTKMVGGSASRHMVQLTQCQKRKKTCLERHEAQRHSRNSETQTYTDSHRVARVKRNRTHANPCCDTRLQRSETQATGSKEEREGEEAAL